MQADKRFIVPAVRVLLLTTGCGGPGEPTTTATGGDHSVEATIEG